jgi:hypothetical protein
VATTNVDTSFPDVELAPGSTITVDTGDASATITLLNVYTLSPVTGARAEEVEPAPYVPLFVYGPVAAV